MSIIRSISTLYTRNRYVMLVLLQYASVDKMEMLLRVCSVEILMMMDSGLLRNMWSNLSKKSEK